MTKQPVPCGSWNSPISAKMIATGTLKLLDVVVRDQEIYWLESRPTEQGRHVVVRKNAKGEACDLMPAPFSARSVVYAYGGGSFAVSTGAALTFVNYVNDASDPDQRLFGAAPGRRPRAITQRGAMRYGDLEVHDPRGRCLAVREDWSAVGKGAKDPHHPTVAILSVAADGTEEVLLDGNDFYASPRISPDGSKLAWLTWNWPCMPWDGCQLWTAELDKNGRITRGSERLIAGSDTESIFQPQWSPDGVLHFVSDRTGWWNIFRLAGRSLEAVTHRDAEFGAPMWTLGMSTYAFASATRIVATFTERGSWTLATIDTLTGAVETITPRGYTSFRQVRAGDGFAVCIAGGPAQPEAVLRIDLESGRPTVVKSSSTVDRERLLPYISTPEPITFKTTDGAVAHGFYHPPKSKHSAVPKSEKPPLIIMTHGGPSAAASTVLDLQIQYFTSRGLGVVDVNYRGSSGFGRDYLLSLYGKWGVADVDDCVAVAEFLEARGDADPLRIAARGGSAGGYTTINLATFRTKLACGASYYGISNLIQLVAMCENFEAHYVDELVGPLPKTKKIYRARSAVFHAGRSKTPVVFFQGENDPVVPVDQTKQMVAAMIQRGVPVASIIFPGEQHGFRIADNIKTALESELYFYSQFMGFEAADKLKPLEIHRGSE